MLSDRTWQPDLETPKMELLLAVLRSSRLRIFQNCITPHTHMADDLQLLADSPQLTQDERQVHRDMRMSLFPHRYSEAELMSYMKRTGDIPEDRSSVNCAPPTPFAAVSGGRKRFPPLGTRYPHREPSSPPHPVDRAGWIKTDIMMAVHAQNLKHGAFKDAITASTSVYKDLEVLSKSALFDEPQQTIFSGMATYLLKGSYDTKPWETAIFRSNAITFGYVFDCDMWRRGVWADHVAQSLKQFALRLPKGMMVVIHTTEPAKNMIRSGAIQAGLDPAWIAYADKANVCFPFFKGEGDPWAQFRGAKSANQRERSGKKATTAKLADSAIQRGSMVFHPDDPVDSLFFMGPPQIGPDWGPYGAEKVKGDTSEALVSVRGSQTNGNQPLISRRDCSIEHQH